MGDIIGFIGLVVFVVGFIALGTVFLRKKRTERIEETTRELERIQGPVAPEVPEAVSQPTQPTLASASAPAEKQATLTDALKSTRSGFWGRISSVLSRGDESAVILEELEAILIGADVGVKTTDRLLESLKAHVKGNDWKDIEKVKSVLRAEIAKLLSQVEVKPILTSNVKPFVTMFVGVNGVGKTTTIGKLAHQLTQEGKSVVLGAGDTFRAAAKEQLAVWAERTSSPIVTGENEADPSSVLFDTVKKAKEQGADVVLCDTAGRLHTKVNLMQELKKVHRVLGKALEGAPQEVFLVVDATTGQNAVMQAKQFSEVAPLTGVVLTKLDGTAKGGIVLAIVDELKIPIRYIGVGEAAKDLRLFDPDAFVDALFDDDASK